MTPAETWDKQVREAGGHLLQSWKWGAFKQRHDWFPERVLVESPSGSALAQILYRYRGPASIGYVPRGPVISGDPASLWPELRSRIDRAARRHRAIMTVFEPNEVLRLSDTFRTAGLVRGPAHFQPGRTVKVPLLEDEAILKQMHQKTRYSVRLAQRRKVTVEHRACDKESIDQFYMLMRDTSERNEFGIHSYEYYEDFLKTFDEDAALFFARVDDDNIGAALIAATFGLEAIYMYGASSTEHRSHGAAFLLQFEAMRWARSRGCMVYDLWGIPDVDPESTRSENQTTIAGTKGEDWRGLFRFKTGFGGDIVSYPPTMERRHVPVLPWLARKLNVIRE
jgi:lipid II:glycine glycyltransferase (peptidoglycan interpeptide bridge formation enzyme)